MFTEGERDVVFVIVASTLEDLDLEGACFRIRLVETIYGMWRF